MHRLRDKFDAMAWHSIMTRRATMPEHKGLALSGRPKDFGELEQMLRSGKDPVLAFAMFLDELYLFKESAFFETEPSEYFERHTAAFLAAVTEFLCHKFEIPVPEWTEKPRYYLSEHWQKSHDDTREPEFARRGIGYNPRHLTRL